MPRIQRPAWLDPGLAALGTTFLVNGVAYTSLLPRLPDVKGQLALSATELGLALAGMGAGGLAGSVLAPRLVGRWGGRGVSIAAGVALALGVLGVGLLAASPLPDPAWLFLGLGLAVVGTADGIHDVAMNYVALAAQRRAGRSLLGRLHALWSAGALVGAGSGALAAGLGVPVTVQLAVVAAVLIGLQGIARGYLPATASPVAASTPDGSAAAEPPTGMAAREIRARRRAWLVLGAAAVAAAFVEGPANEWSAVHLRDGLGASAFVAGLGPAAVAGAMLAGRLVSDHWIDRFGPDRVARAAALVVAVGMATGLLLAALWNHPAPALVGYTAAGAGAAPMFPLLFTAAADAPGRAATGESVVASVSRVGFLVAPALVGWVADATTLGWAMGVVVVGAAVLALFLPSQLPARSPTIGNQVAPSNG